MSILSIRTETVTTLTHGIHGPLNLLKVLVAFLWLALSLKSGCRWLSLLYFNGWQQGDWQTSQDYGNALNKSLQNTLKCYPNPVPANGMVHLTLPNRSLSTVKWYTINGHEVRSEQVSGVLEVVFSTNLAPGTYWLEVLNKGGWACSEISRLRYPTLGFEDRVQCYGH